MVYMLTVISFSLQFLYITFYWDLLFDLLILFQIIIQFFT